MSLLTTAAKKTAQLLRRFRTWAYRLELRLLHYAAVHASLPRLRLAICETCPLYTSMKTCSKCKCFMPAKVHLPNARCPDKRW